MSRNDWHRRLAALRPLSGATRAFCPLEPPLSILPASTPASRIWSIRECSSAGSGKDSLVEDMTRAFVGAAATSAIVGAIAAGAPVGEVAIVSAAVPIGLGLIRRFRGR